MTKTTRNALAYVAITGTQRRLHVDTRIALIGMTELDVKTCRYTLTDEGRQIAEQTPMWQSHRKLLAMGFEFDTSRRRIGPGFIPYRHPERAPLRNGGLTWRHAFLRSQRHRLRRHAERRNGFRLENDGGHVMTCPWCGSHAPTLRTAEHLDEAEFVYSNPSPAAAACNPVMCSECHGVGGREDFIDFDPPDIDPHAEESMPDYPERAD